MPHTCFADLCVVSATSCKEASARHKALRTCNPSSTSFALPEPVNPHQQTPFGQHAVTVKECQLLLSPSAFGQEPIRRLLKRARYCSGLVGQSWRGTNNNNR